MVPGHTWGALYRYMAAYQEAVPRLQMSSKRMSGGFGQSSGQWKLRELGALWAGVIEAGFKQVVLAAGPGRWAAERAGREPVR